MSPCKLYGTWNKRLLLLQSLQDWDDFKMKLEPERQPFGVVLPPVHLTQSDTFKTSSSSVTLTVKLKVVPQDANEGETESPKISGLTSWWNLFDTVTSLGL